MNPRDILAAVVAAAALGLSFIGIKIGVHEAPPLTLASPILALRSRISAACSSISRSMRLSRSSTPLAV